MLLQSPPRRLFLIFAAIMIVSAGAAADVNEAPFSFTIMTRNDASLGNALLIPVTKLAGSDPVYGFDFLIQYDAVALTLNDVTPGPIFDIPGANEWESFSFSVDSVGGDPTGFVHVVAVADINDGSHHPSDYHLANDAVLFTLRFGVTLDESYACNWYPIRFYWTDCGDNALALDSLGTNLGISSQVYSWSDGYMDLTDPEYGFPGIYGAPDECLASPGVSREIDFYGGGFDIHCYGGIDDIGDINCNGLAYEIADVVMFINYFLYGITAFGDHPEYSQANSDVNFDGNELQLEDLIYLYRVIIGEVDPLTGPVPLDTAAVTFTQDDDAKTVTVDYPDSLSALRLVFDGEITPTININVEGYFSDYFLEGGSTIVMIAPSDPIASLPSQFIVDEPILTYTGSALLTEASAADFNDRVFHTQIRSSGGDLTAPYAFEIGEIPNTAPGNIIHIPVVKTNGSEPMSGFDFLIGYDAYGISITDVTPGVIFESLGDYQWEYFNYSFGPFDCGGDCPSGLIRIVGLADTPDGSHQPLQTNIPDGTTLFTLFGTVTTDPTYAGLFIPARYFWIDCGVNGVAFGSTGDTLAVSDHVYDYNGTEITDRGYGLPGYYGAPDSCYANPANPARFANFKNGGVQITPLDSMELILSLDTVSANLGDTAVYIDVYLSNPHDSVAGFELTVMTNQPDIIAFGASPEDSTAIGIENTLIENWNFIVQKPMPGNRQQVGVVGFSDDYPPYLNAIPPGFNGLLCRLIAHVNDSLPLFVEDSTVFLHIIDWTTETAFTDPQGNLLGVVDGEYDSSTVTFGIGSISILVPLDGDANGDGAVNVADAVYLIGYIFKSGPAPSPLEAGDTNCDGAVNIADAVYLITYIFKSGPPPCSP